MSAFERRTIFFNLISVESQHKKSGIFTFEIVFTNIKLFFHISL